jgi:hypothetical protein
VTRNSEAIHSSGKRALIVRYQSRPGFEHGRRYFLITGKCHKSVIEASAKRCKIDEETVKREGQMLGAGLQQLIGFCCIFLGSGKFL